MPNSEFMPIGEPSVAHVDGIEVSESTQQEWLKATTGHVALPVLRSRGELVVKLTSSPPESWRVL